MFILAQLVGFLVLNSVCLIVAYLVRTEIGKGAALIAIVMLAAACYAHYCHLSRTGHPVRDTVFEYPLMVIFIFASLALLNSYAAAWLWVGVAITFAEAIRLTIRSYFVKEAIS